MKTQYFNVKGQSAQEFFDKYALAQDPEIGNRGGGDQRISAYHLMREVIYLKKEVKELLDTGQDFCFELFDESRMTGKKLINTYIYGVTDYDSISVRLVLIDFKVSVNDNK